MATVAVFLPAVVLVGLAHAWLGRARDSASLSAAIEGLNAAAIGLIGFSVVVLAREALVPEGAFDVVAAILAVGAFLLLLTSRVGPVPLLIGGALIGFVVQVSRAA